MPSQTANRVPKPAVIPLAARLCCATLPPKRFSVAPSMTSTMQFSESSPTFLSCLASLACLLMLGTSPASAGDAPEAPEPEYSQYYTGAFHEYSMRGGLTLPANSDYRGWHVDIGVRHSFPFLIGDFRVAYQFDRLESDEASQGPLDQHGLGGYLAIHPGYLLLLGSDWLSYTLASVHLELGGGAKMGVVQNLEAGDFETGLGPFVSIGGGFDVPLGDPDTGAAPWLNFVYHWQVADFDDRVETFDLDSHVVQIGLGWRINGLLF